MRCRFPRGLQLFLMTLIVAIAVLMVNSCVAPSPALPPLVIGYGTWPGYQVLLYAQAKGLFEKQGLTVELQRFDNLPDNLRATMRGYLDASFTTLAEVMLADFSKAVPEIILVTNISAGSDGIVARPGISSVADLVGKKVSASSGTVEYLALMEALAANNVDAKTLDIVDMAYQHAIDRLKKGKIDAATLWEPDLSKVATEIGGKVIYTTADVDSMVVDVVATRAEVVQEKRASLIVFLKVWLEIMDAIEVDPNSVFATVAQQLQVSPAEFAADYQGLKKGDRAMNRRLLIDGRLNRLAQETYRLLAGDPQHGRIVHATTQINDELITQAMQD